MARPAFSEMPDLVLLRIADFLTPEDTTKLSMTCRRLKELLPTFLVMRGPDISSRGRGTGMGTLETYFNGPKLHKSVKHLTVSVESWKDQGWGNRKGELFVRLMRAEDVIVAERRDFFGLAEHVKTSAKLVMTRADEAVEKAQPGDWYQFMKRVGGGGGHKLIVRGFRAVALLQK